MVSTYIDSSSQITKTPGSTSIRYRSDTKVSDRYLIDVDPRVFAIWDIAYSKSFLPNLRQRSPHGNPVAAFRKTDFNGRFYLHYLHNSSWTLSAFATHLCKLRCQLLIKARSDGIENGICLMERKSPLTFNHFCQRHYRKLYECFDEILYHLLHRKLSFSPATTYLTLVILTKNIVW